MKINLKDIPYQVVYEVFVRPTLDGRQVNIVREWDKLRSKYEVKLPEEQETPQPAPVVLALVEALECFVEWYEQVNLRNEPCFQYYDKAKKALDAHYKELGQYLKGSSVKVDTPPEEVNPECPIVQFFLAFLASNGKAPSIGTLIHTFEQQYTSVQIQETRAALLRRATEDLNRYVPRLTVLPAFNVSQRLERVLQMYIRDRYRENFRIPDYSFTRKVMMSSGWDNICPYEDLPSIGEFIQMYVSAVLAIDFKELRLGK